MQTILFPAHRARFVRVNVVGTGNASSHPGGAMLKWLGERIETVWGVGYRFAATPDASAATDGGGR